MTTAREIIRQADTKRTGAGQLQKISDQLTATSGRITEVTLGNGMNRTTVTFEGWALRDLGIDPKAVLVEMLTKTVATLLEEADALEAQIRVVELR